MYAQLSIFDQEKLTDHSFTKPCTEKEASAPSVILLPGVSIQASSVQNPDTGEGISWVYSTDRIVKKKNGSYEVIPAKLKKDGIPKKVPLNAKKGGTQEVYPIKTRDEIAKVSEWLFLNDKKYFLAFTLGFNLGLRANELLSLRYRHLLNPDGSIRYQPDDDTDTTDLIHIYQKKVHKHREIYLNDACVKAINIVLDTSRRNLYSDEFIFLSREASSKFAKAKELLSKDKLEDLDRVKAIGVDTLRDKIKKAGRDCGIRQNLGTHTMRKSFGYFHYKQNGDIAFLQELFGHSSQLMTMRYIGMASEERKKAYHEVSIDTVQMLIENGVLKPNSKSE